MPAIENVAFPGLAFRSTPLNVTWGLVAPGPTRRPETITYRTAASTTVIATIRMVAMTGDTAASSLRMILFMVLSSCGFRRVSYRGVPTLLNVSRLILGIENHLIKGPL